MINNEWKLRKLIKTNVPDKKEPEQNNNYQTDDIIKTNLIGQFELKLTEIRYQNSLWSQEWLNLSSSPPLPLRKNRTRSKLQNWPTLSRSALEWTKTREHSQNLSKCTKQDEIQLNKSNKGDQIWLNVNKSDRNWSKRIEK